MSAIYLVRIGELDAELLAGLRDGIERILRIPAVLSNLQIDPSFALHPERRQLHSTELLARLEKAENPEAWRVLGVTAADLYIPILTFVFGEAQVSGRCAVVSTCRLQQEFYGLPGDGRLLSERLLKESLHELGHTLGLVHCDDYRCAMSPAHSVEWIDVREARFCPRCLFRMLASNAG